MSNKKILVNGCGFTFGNQCIKSWPKILSSVGVDIVDLSGPAVSNQWIVDRTTEYLLNNAEIATVIIQLSTIDKLDIEITNKETGKAKTIGRRANKSLINGKR